MVHELNQDGALFGIKQLDEPANDASESESNSRSDTYPVKVEKTISFTVRTRKILSGSRSRASERGAKKVSFPPEGVVIFYLAE